MKKAVYSVLLFVTVLSGIGLQSYYAEPVKTQWREVINLVEVNSKDNDAIAYCDWYCGTPINHYYQGALILNGIGCDVENTQELANFVDDITYEKDRLWLIICHCEDKPAVWSYLENRYVNGIVLEEEFGGVSVILFDLSPP